MNVYVVIFHDVWDLGRDPGHENENGEPEETSIDAIFTNRHHAEDWITLSLASGAEAGMRPSHSFYTIEEHLLK